MACCTMSPEDGALPRGDAEGDGEVYHKNDEESSISGNLVGGFGGMVITLFVTLTQKLNRFATEETFVSLTRL